SWCADGFGGGTAFDVRAHGRSVCRFDPWMSNAAGRAAPLAGQHVRERRAGCFAPMRFTCRNRTAPVYLRESSIPISQHRVSIWHALRRRDESAGKDRLPVRQCAGAPRKRGGADAAWIHGAAELATVAAATVSAFSNSVSGSFAFISADRRICADTVIRSVLLSADAVRASS